VLRALHGAREEANPAPSEEAAAEAHDDGGVETPHEARAMLSELASLDDSEPVAPTPTEKPKKRPVPSSSSETFNVDDDGITWTCGRCGTVNEFADNECSVCGATFADAIKPPEEPRPPRDANTAAMVSLFLPGAGHAYVGLWGQAVARAVISIWVVAVAIFSAAQSAPQARIMSVLFGLVALGLWLVGAHDAYREASNESRSALLKQRFFLHLVLGLLVLSVLMIFSTALGARPA
jgi:hypothetical protein